MKRKVKLQLKNHIFNFNLLLGCLFSVFRRSFRPQVTVAINGKITKPFAAGVLGTKDALATGSWSMNPNGTWLCKCRAF